MRASSAIETSPIVTSRRVFEPDAGERRSRPERDRDALEAILTELRDLADVLRRGPRDPETKKHGLSALQLVDRARTAPHVVDGWSDHSPGADSPDKPPRDVVDQAGNLIDRTDDTAGFTTSTERAAIVALNRQQVDPDRLAVRQLADHARVALHELQAAVNLLYKRQPATAPVDAGEPCCKSCARLGKFEPVYDKALSSELCRWCYDFWLAQKCQPNLAILEKRHAGGRITTADLRAAGYKT